LRSASVFPLAGAQVAKSLLRRNFSRPCAQRMVHSIRGNFLASRTMQNCLARYAPKHIPLLFVTKAVFKRLNYKGQKYE